MKTIMILVLMMSTTCLYAQDTLHRAYYSYLKTILLADPTVKKVKYIEKRYSNGNIKCQNMNIKLKSDKLNRYWRVGNFYCYYKNGEVSGKGTIDLRTKTLRDTSFHYDENAQLADIRIYNNYSKYSSISFIQNSLFISYYVCVPDYYRTIFFENGKKRSEVHSSYNIDSKFFDTILEATYDENEKLIDMKEYKDGVLVEY